MSTICIALLVSFLFASKIFCHGEETGYGISGNPGAVNILTGTGELGNLLRIPKSSGVRLAGLWMGDGNLILEGVAKFHFFSRKGSFRHI